MLSVEQGGSSGSGPHCLTPPGPWSSLLEAPPQLEGRSRFSLGAAGAHGRPRKDCWIGVANYSTTQKHFFFFLPFFSFTEV